MKVSELKKVLSEEQATAELNEFFDRRIIFPKRREALAAPIEAVVEAMTFGLVAIHEDGSITQKLCVPVGPLTELKYVADVPSSTISKLISNLKVYTQTNINMEYISAYTTVIKAQIEKMHPTDRNLADALAFFYQ